jgi:hypothetical protein
MLCVVCLGERLLGDNRNQMDITEVMYDS